MNRMISCAALAGFVFLASGAQAQCPQLLKLTAFDGQVLDRYGNAVAAGTNYAAVAEKLDTQGGSNAGAVYVYKPQGGSLVLDQKVMPADLQPEDLFGFSVCLEGDRMAVGAYGEDEAGPEAGAVYVFRRDATGWVEEAKILPPTPGTLQFGSDVDMTRSTLLVGAVGSDLAEVFVRAGTTWSHQGTLSSTNPTVDQFGFSVSVSGDNAVVGARGTSSIVGAGGATYIYRRSGGTWSQTQELLPTDVSAFDQFGASVAVSDRLLLVGAPFQSTNGTVYAFSTSGPGTFQFHSKLTPTGAIGTNGLFGFAVDLDGDQGLVGAQAMDTTAGLNTGAAYQFQFAASAWTQVGQHVANDAAFGDSFGVSVSLGAAALIGAEFDGNGNGFAAGSAYAFGICP